MKLSPKLLQTLALHCNIIIMRVDVLSKNTSRM